MSRAETERQLLALINLHPGKSVTGLSRRSGLSGRLIGRTVAALIATGKL